MVDYHALSAFLAGKREEFAHRGREGVAEMAGGAFNDQRLVGVLG